MTALFVDEDRMRPALRWRSTPPGVLQAIVMHALHLRPALREPFLLCDIQGCSITEAALILGTNPNSVVAKLEHARRQMDDVVTRLCERPDTRD